MRFLHSFPSLSTQTRRARLLAAAATATVLLFAGFGCETTGSSNHRASARATSLAPAPNRVLIAPLDVEVAELTASGAVEPHAEWTAQASADLLDALQGHTGYVPYPVEHLQDSEVTNELQEVAALVRTMNFNQLAARTPQTAGLVPPSAGTLGFDYETGRLSAHSEKTDAGAVLFIFLRESYATGGRKALAALGLVSAAFTGVYVAPTMGTTLAAAALVDTEGRVLWLNQLTTAPDLRTREGIERLVQALCSGLPEGEPTTP